MLIDEVTIKVEAGNGGKGAAIFNKNLLTYGPTGGSGGRGGSIYLEGVSDLNALMQFRHKKEVKAANGEDARMQLNDGPDGGDLIVNVPVGAIITLLETGHTHELLHVGERIMVARGGRGGKGNFHYRSATNTSPREFEFGKPGERFTMHIELKLIADIGFIGLPNAGKSTLLNELTNAQSKVGNYPFTTLEPNLGVYYELILVDIPGLIEGASGGKGLGIKFLRHIERTRILFQLISADSDSPVKDYRTIRHELKTHNAELVSKPEYVFLSKSDTIAVSDLKKKITALKRINKNTFPLSIHDWESMENIKQILNRIQDEK